MSDTGDYVGPSKRPPGTCQSFDACAEQAGPGGLCVEHRRRALAFMGEPVEDDSGRNAT